jgi:hypothetical protein
MTKELAHAPTAIPHPRPGDAAQVQRWRGFATRLDQHTLNTALLQRWLGTEVHIGALATAMSHDEAAGRVQHRELTIVAALHGGEPVVVCRATARVHLDLLPPWAQQALTGTRVPLGHTLARVGAVRDRSRLRYPATAADPDAPGLAVDGTFRLPGEGGAVVAVVSEAFTGHVLLGGPSGPARADESDLDRIDAELVTLLTRRIAARRAAVPDQLLRCQLVGAFGTSQGNALFQAITLRR